MLYIIKSKHGHFVCKLVVDKFSANKNMVLSLKNKSRDFQIPFSKFVVLLTHTLLCSCCCIVIIITPIRVVKVFEGGWPGSIIPSTSSSQGNLKEISEKKSIVECNHGRLRSRLLIPPRN